MADEQDPARPEARLHNNLSHVQNLNMQTYSISQQLGEYWDTSSNTD